MSDNQLTIVAVDTLFYDLSLLAVQRTARIINPRDIIYLSDKDWDLANSTQITIDPFSDKDRYNQIVIESLAKIISTTHTLIVQYDGFALNETLWDEMFLSYDYIGAPWPNFEYHQVGNGGFSLRSKRLIEIVADLAHLRPQYEAEDLFICRTIRPILENKFHIRFAPPEVALKFSFESPSHSKSAFGFHGVLNLAIAHQDDPELFFSKAPASIYIDRARELAFGLNFVSQEKKAKFIGAWRTAIESSKRLP